MFAKQRKEKVEEAGCQGPAELTGTMGQGRLLLLLLAAALLAAADSSDFDDDDDATLGASGAVTDAITIEVPVPRSRLGACPATRARPVLRP